MLLEQGDALFFHDTLSPIDKALYFHEFIAAGSHGLRFLAKTEFPEMPTAALPERIRQRLKGIDDVIEREQLVDFLEQRMFRRTLCHAGVAVDSVGAPRAAGHARRRRADRMDRRRDDGEGRVQRIGRDRGGLSTDHPLLIGALQRIGAAWPAAVAMEDLAGDDPESLAVVCQALLPYFAANLLRLHAHPPALSSVPGARPRAARSRACRPVAASS